MVASGTIFTDKAEENAELNPRGAVFETNAASILKQIREVLQEHGPTQENYLLEALGPSLTHVIFEEHGTLSAFLHRYPGFQVVRKDLYMLVYYQDFKEGEAGGRSFLAQSGATPSSEKTLAECPGRHQLAEAADLRSRSVCSNSSSSDPYESAVDGEEERERRPCSLKNSFTGVPSRPRAPRSRRAGKRMRDAEVQTQLWYPNPVAELEYTLQKRKAEIGELQEALKNLQLSQARELQQLRTTISKLLKKPPPTPQWSNTGATNTLNDENEWKPTAAACAQDSLLPESRARRPRYASFRSRSENRRGLDMDPKSRPLPSVDKNSRMPLKLSPATEFPERRSRNSRPRHRRPSVDRKSRRSLTRVPVEEFREFPGPERSHRSRPRLDKPKRMAQQSPKQKFSESPGYQTSASVPGPLFQSVTSSPGGYATRSRSEKQASATARSGSQEHSRDTERGNRCRTDNSHWHQDEFSRMNFNAIVALMLGHPQSTSQAKP
ncbi:hypothetical protein MRX96_050051 [Rhipicephalus microplus]